MRRVVRLITRMNIGGPARQALLLTRSLEPDYETVLAAGRPAHDEGELADPRVPVRDVGLVRPLQPRLDLAAFRRVRELVATTRPQVVHTHMAKAGTIGRLATWSVDRSIRKVHTYHGHVLEGYFGRTVTRGFLEVERRLARTTDVIIAISPEIRDELLDLGIGRPSQYRVIRLGLDLQEHLSAPTESHGLRSELGLAPATPLVGIIGRLVPIKDHQTALRTIAQLPGVHLAVIGDGERRAHVERQAQELGIADRVHFLGWRFDIPSVIAGLDVVLLTSLNEGTPVSLIEAAACGKPVVTTDVGGARSVVTDGVTGKLAAAGDANGLSEALAELLGSPRLRERMGVEGRLSVMRFSEARLTAEIRDLYDEMLRPSG